MVAFHQPHDPGKPQQDDSQEGEADNHVHDVLYHAVALHRQGAGKDSEEYDYYTLLPWLNQPVAVETLEIGNDDIASTDDDQYAREPGTEGGKKAPIATEGLVRPIIEGAFVGKHDTELGRGDHARNKEGSSGDEPVGKGGGPTCHGGCGVGDKKDNHQVGGCHVQRTE